MSNAVIYARYSSEKQTELSIEAQLRACNEYAARKGLSIVRTYADEAISGKGSETENRKEYQRMIRDCAAGQFGTILIHKYDRVARSLAEHVSLEVKLHNMNVELVAVAQDFGTNKEAKIMRALMWSLSEYYIDNLAEETRKGLKEIALKGLYTGGVAPVVHMEDVDKAAVAYLQELLSSGNQKTIAAALREYQSTSTTTAEDFRKALQDKIIHKQKQYDALLNNLSTGALPPEVVTDVGQKMKDIKEEIVALELTEPPKDFTVDNIKAWLDSIKKAPDKKAIQLLIDRIDIKNKTDITITSTLTSVLGKTV